MIRAEGLGKKYLIGHQAERERYTALRDVMARGAAILAQAADMARGRAIVAGDTVEEFWALKDVNFEVKRGEVLGIIGRNGAGKSTLLKISQPHHRADRGPRHDHGPGREPAGGRHRLSPRTDRPREHLSQRRDPRHDPRRDHAASSTRSSPSPRSRSSSTRRSSAIRPGMYVRLAFAVAAHLEPEILIVDEVLAVGDAEFQKKCLGKMSEMSPGGGRTVLFVSHNMGAIEALCPRSVHLASGVLLADGPTE